MADTWYLKTIVCEAPSKYGGTDPRVVAVPALLVADPIADLDRPSHALTTYAVRYPYECIDGRYGPPSTRLDRASELSLISDTTAWSTTRFLLLRKSRPFWESQGLTVGAVKPCAIAPYEHTVPLPLTGLFVPGYNASIDGVPFARFWTKYGGSSSQLAPYRVKLTGYGTFLSSVDSEILGRPGLVQFLFMLGAWLCFVQVCKMAEPCMASAYCCLCGACVSRGRAPEDASSMV